jgi:hypothetical protein
MHPNTWQDPRGVRCDRSRRRTPRSCTGRECATKVVSRGSLQNMLEPVQPAPHVSKVVQRGMPSGRNALRWERLPRRAVVGDRCLRSAAVPVVSKRRRGGGRQRAEWCQRRLGHLEVRSMARVTPQAQNPMCSMPNEGRNRAVKEVQH